LKNELVQRQIGDRFAQPAIFELKFLQPLVLSSAAIFLAPAIIGHSAHADLADRIRHALSLRRQNINLPKLGDNLFSLATPSWPSRLSKDIPQVGPLHWGWISDRQRTAHRTIHKRLDIRQPNAPCSRSFHLGFLYLHDFGIAEMKPIEITDRITKRRSLRPRNKSWEANYANDCRAR
jgi:hypothetical protein